MAEEQKNLDEDVSSLVKKHAREVSAQGLAGKVKVLSRSAIKDIVDSLIRSYGGLEHQELISKIAEYELNENQLQQKISTLQGKLEVLEKQNADLKARDEKFVASKAVDASRIPMLEEQNATLKKTVEGLEAEKENLRRKMEELRSSMGDEVKTKLGLIDGLNAELAELKPRLAGLEQENSGFAGKLSDREAQLKQLTDAMDQSKALHDREIADRDEMIGRLKRALDQSDAKKRIMELEVEIKDLRRTIQTLEIGLEFVGVEADMRPEDVIARIGKARTAASKLPPGLAGRLDELEAEASMDGKIYKPLIDAMYSNNGSIQVACDLTKMLARQKEILRHVETIEKAGK